MNKEVKKKKKPSSKSIIKVCYGPSCSKHFPEYIKDRADAEVEDNPKAVSEATGCLGHCKKSPNASINGRVYNFINGPKLAKIIKNNCSK